MIFSFHGKFVHAVICVGIAALCAGLGCTIGERFHNISEIGKSYRSLSELISFGAAPSIIIYPVLKLPTFSLLLASLFIICGALRLARYNITTTSNPNCYTGLPIQAAGLLLTLLAILPFQWEMKVLIIISICYLMVSRINIPRFYMMR
ncbi:MULTISPECIES: phosphatidylcholine/phosphatidylserine synthase [unclassified Paenibacillus]|uniref:CDP-alcohol phosphatidyltransferase family protein n=1 Tax=unclassified Paenibacillus TaxID=185978 RepID=UPI00115F790C|nr:MULTISPECIES: hypothetical protein [unclassified Paenibacillus]